MCGDSTDDCCPRLVDQGQHKNPVLNNVVICMPARQESSEGKFTTYSGSCKKNGKTVSYGAADLNVEENS